VRRLRIVASLYTAAFFLAGPLPALLTAKSRAIYFGAPDIWLPSISAIAGGLAVVALTGSKRVRERARLRAGLVFEVLGSFGIAAAEYHHISAPIMYGDYGPGGGLSWVAV
jgi:hypothetical protein